MTSTLQTCTAHPVCCEACAANWGWYSYDTDMHSSPSLLWDLSSQLRLVHLWHRHAQLTQFVVRLVQPAEVGTSMTQNWGWYIYDRTEVGTSMTQTCTAHPVCCETCAANWGWYIYDTELRLVHLWHRHAQLTQFGQPVVRHVQPPEVGTASQAMHRGQLVVGQVQAVQAAHLLQVHKLYQVLLKHHQYSYELSSSSWNSSNKSVNRYLPETSPVQLWIIQFFLKHH